MKKYILIFSALVLMAGSGCKSWLDINQNPNDATETNVTMAHLLPNCEYNILRNHASNAMAMQLSQHLTKSGEYSGNYVYLAGNIMPQNTDDYWQPHYTINNDLLAMYRKAEEAEDDAYMGMSRVLFALNTQRLVDQFGGVPYSQAWDPAEYPQPEYDSDQAIYNDLLTKVDEGISHLQAAISKGYQTSALAKVDIFCNGNLQLWIRFANSVKLRLLMRMSGVQDVSSTVNAIAGNCLDIYEDVTGNPGYYAETNKMNVFYEAYGWDKNGSENTNHRQYMPTSSLVDMLRDNNNPLLRVLCDPRQTLGNPPDGADYEKFHLEDERYIGIPYGQAAPPGRYFCCWTGTGLMAGSSDKNTGRLRASIIFSGAEVGFFLAEAALKGYVPGGDAKAKEYYEAAVTAVMKRHEAAMQDNGYELNSIMAPAITGSAEDAAREFLSQNNSFVNWDLMTTNEQKLEAIGSQKWISYFGYNSLEAWFETRRLDYPVLTASNQGMENKLICRLPYPQTEMNNNTINYDKQPAVDVYNSLVFWDLKNDVVMRAELYE